jgi:DNA gyrase/topoisomerase IV subunit A
VITQIIIIIVFFYRLQIDQEIADLSETLRQQKEIVAVLQPFIKDVKAKYTRFNRIKKILEDQKFIRGQLDYLISIFPADFTLSRLEINEEGVTMEGKTANYLTIMKFKNRVEKDGYFKKVRLTSIRKQGITFDFVFELSDFKLAAFEK